MSAKPSPRTTLTPQQQRAAGITSVLIVMMLVLGVLVLAWDSHWAGMYAHPKANGRGTVQIVDCHSSPAHLSVCNATVVAWQDGSHEAGEAVVVIAYGHPASPAEVVSRERTVSTYVGIPGNILPRRYEEEVITPADQWVMPNWLRPVWVILNALAWFLAAMAMAKLVYRLVPGASSPQERPADKIS